MCSLLFLISAEGAPTLTTHCNARYQHVWATESRRPAAQPASRHLVAFPRAIDCISPTNHFVRITGKTAQRSGCGPLRGHSLNAPSTIIVCGLSVDCCAASPLPAGLSRAAPTAATRSRQAG